MTLADMGETRPNHTVYNINYHFVWCPKYRHSVLAELEQSLEVAFREVCRVQLRDIVVAYLARPRTSVCFSTSETFPERDCTENQEHHSQRDVEATRTTLGKLLLGWRILGRIVLHWNGW